MTITFEKANPIWAALHACHVTITLANVFRVLLGSWAWQELTRQPGHERHDQTSLWKDISD
jgi:hypothetical protein